MAITDKQKEQIANAIDSIHDVMIEIEESGKNKRIWNALDKAIRILYNILEN